MVKGDRQAWKAAYFEKAQRLLTQYEKIFVCDADNVTSKQFQDIRTGMRGHGYVLMGKNTMIKKAIKINNRTRVHCGAIVKETLGMKIEPTCGCLTFDGRDVIF